MTTMDKINNNVDRVTKLIEQDELSPEEWNEIQELNIKINAKLMVLNKFEEELNVQLDILYKKLNDFEYKYS